MSGHRWNPLEGRDHQDLRDFAPPEPGRRRGRGGSPSRAWSTGRAVELRRAQRSYEVAS